MRHSEVGVNVLTTARVCSCPFTKGRGVRNEMRDLGLRSRLRPRGNGYSADVGIIKAMKTR
jgi:hypothetical protein